MTGMGVPFTTRLSPVATHPGKTANTRAALTASPTRFGFCANRVSFTAGWLRSDIMCIAMVVSVAPALMEHGLEDCAQIYTACIA